MLNKKPKAAKPIVYFKTLSLPYVLDYAKQHHDIILKFNRFPHRNNILNRPSTKEEIEFLKQPGSSF